MELIGIFYLLPMWIMLVVHLLFKYCKKDEALTISEKMDFAWAEKETVFIAFLPGLNLLVVIALIYDYFGGRK